MTISYGTRPADPLFRREHADATEVVVLHDGRPARVLGVFQTSVAAESVVANLNAHTEFQIR
jgi:hypothetical protein